MTIISTDRAQAFTPSLSMARLQEVIPAAFADRPFAGVSDRYVFISTRTLVAALIDAGFNPVDARQTRSRGDRASFTKHIISFQPARESLTLVDAVPRIVVVNAHDATSNYQVRAGLFRPACTNGLLTRIGDFGLISVAHRGNVVANIVDAALSIMQGFDNVTLVVNEMSTRIMTSDELDRFAAAAAHLRYGDDPIPYHPARLLEARRECDHGRDVWRVFNIVQENLMRGGIIGKSATGRTTHTRSIRAIREDVRINTGLWQLAMALLHG